VRRQHLARVHVPDEHDDAAAIRVVGGWPQWCARVERGAIFADEPLDADELAPEHAAGDGAPFEFRGLGEGGEAHLAIGQHHHREVVGGEHLALVHVAGGHDARL
jgi:hypothetical protein